MIPKNKNPLESIEELQKPIIEQAIRDHHRNKNPLLDEEKVKQWQKTFDENREQRTKNNLKAYGETLCECGHDKVKLKK